MSHKPVDFDTVPKFQERDLAFGQPLKLAILDIGLLALFNLVAKFHKYAIVWLKVMLFQGITL